MTVRIAVVSTVTLLILLPCVATKAAFDEWAIGLKTGTLGIGGELTTDILPQLNLRGSVQWFGLDLDDIDIGDVSYDLDLTLLNPMLLVDWYPFGGALRLSGGVLFNQSDVELRARPSEPVEIGDIIYTPGEIGTLTGEADFDEIAPYVGIGFGNAVSEDSRWGLTADLGVAFIGSPGVTLRASGPIAGNAEFQSQLAEEEKDIEDDLENFEFYPVLAVNLYYHF